jgi:hypothetical protein
MSDTQTTETMSTSNTTGTETPGNGAAKALLQEEVTVLSSLRKSANDVVTEIGQLEVRKARLLGSLSEIEARAQGVLNTAGERLDIPDGQPWQVTPDGNIVMIPEGIPGGPAPEAGV